MLAQGHRLERGLGHQLEQEQGHRLELAQGHPWVLVQGHRLAPQQELQSAMQLGDWLVEREHRLVLEHRWVLGRM